MPGAKVKKLSLIAVREDMNSILDKLMKLECVEVFTQDSISESPEITTPLTREVVGLEGFGDYGATEKSIEILGTQFTFLLTGWMSSVFEPELASMLNDYDCAWEISDLSTEEAEIAPSIRKYPRFLENIRGGNNRVLAPLALLHNTNEDSLNSADVSADEVGHVETDIEHVDTDNTDTDKPKEEKL